MHRVRWWSVLGWWLCHGRPGAQTRHWAHPTACVVDEGSLPGRGRLEERCGAANVLSSRDEYVVGEVCSDASGPPGARPCQCCRRPRRVLDEEHLRRRSRDRCTRATSRRGGGGGASSSSSSTLVVFTVSTGGYDLSTFLGSAGNGSAEDGVDFVVFCDDSTCPRASAASTVWFWFWFGSVRAWQGLRSLRLFSRGRPLSPVGPRRQRTRAAGLGGGRTGGGEGVDG